MPSPDPVPTRAQSMLRFRRIMRWMALLSIAVAGIAVLLVMQGEGAAPANMLIATALGAGLTVLLATALMTLAFLSSSSGHDEQARGRGKEGSE